ncbi:MAG: TonB family protein [Muribaculaceae bacterium]|nr:TonB family protein [Muribaculaceae bacterium]
MKFRIIITLIFIFIINISAVFGRQSIDELTEKAKKGDVEAMVVLGNDALEANHYKLAMDWYKKAVKKKSPEAIYRLAMFYIHGLDGKKDIKKGLKMLNQAVEMQYPDAKVALATYYETGLEDFILPDKEMAYNLYLEAAKINNKEALDALSRWLDKASDERKFEILEVKTYIGRDHKAAQQLAGLYFDKDKDKAIEVLKGFDNPDINKLRDFITLTHDAGKGDSKAMYELSAFYGQDVKPFVVSPNMMVGYDPRKEEQLLTGAMQGGIVEAYFKLKDIMFRKGDKNKALNLMETIANQGNTDAMISAGIICINELQDYLAAYKWLNKAQESGNKNISLKINNYGDEYLSFRGEATEYDKNKPIKLRSYCFGIEDGKILTPGMPDYLKYLKEMEKSGEFLIDITPEFTEIIKKYDDVSFFSEGLAIVKKDGKWGAIDTFGKEVIPCNLPFSYISEFNDGLAEVTISEDNENGNWNWRSGFIDMKGNLVIPVTIEGMANPFSEGLAVVVSYGEDFFEPNNDNFYVMDKEGKKIFSGKTNISMFGDGGMPILKFKEGKIYIPTLDTNDWEPILTIYDRSGNKLSSRKIDYAQMDEIFNDINNEKSNYKVVNKMVGPYEDFQWDATGLEDKYGNEILPTIYANVVDLMDIYGVAYISINEVLGTPSYAYGTPDYLIWSDKDINYFGFIDKNGNSTIGNDIIDRCWKSYNIGARLLYEGKDNEEVAKYLKNSDILQKPLDSKNSSINENEIDERINKNEIYEKVDQPAEFPGGQAAMFRWMSSNIRYPEEAQQSEIQGRVVVSFIVEPDGSITKPTIVKGVDESLDKEAVRLIYKMPKWKPGKINGVPVRSYFNIPVTFKLSS